MTTNPPTHRPRPTANQARTFDDPFRLSETSRAVIGWGNFKYEGARLEVDCITDSPVSFEFRTAIHGSLGIVWELEGDQLGMVRAAVMPIGENGAWISPPMRFTWEAFKWLLEERWNRLANS